MPCDDSCMGFTVKLNQCMIGYVLAPVRINTILKAGYKMERMHSFVDTGYYCPFLHGSVLTYSCCSLLLLLGSKLLTLKRDCSCTLSDLPLTLLSKETLFFNFAIEVSDHF